MGRLRKEFDYAGQNETGSGLLKIFFGVTMLDKQLKGAFWCLFCNIHMMPIELHFRDGFVRPI